MTRTRTPSSAPSTRTSSSAARRRNTRRSWPVIAGVVAAVGFAVLIAASVVAADRPEFDASLPNPMGGPAREAPGAVSGTVSFGGLEVTGAEVAMGDVALDITYVPSWEITNPTGDHLDFAVGVPQVREGCCPGPVYVDGELTQAGQTFTVAPGGRALLQFPLQMHRGMGGPHHLTLPLAVGDDVTEVHVTGDFTARAPA